MGEEYIENTLFLGNGFSRNVFEGIPSWEDLFEGQSGDINDYTILYEIYLLNNKKKREDDVKEEFKKKIGDYVSEENVKKNINDLYNFGRYLKDNRVHNIITTNYDCGIEIILCKKCGYKKIERPVGLLPEDIYSIRTYKEFENIEMNHKVKLWQIHGDMERIKSITLGFDHYCGALSKLSNYLKGEYKSKRGIECKTSMIKKCETKAFDGLSWVELFFNTNIYIVGFGMNFSEIDIWWLLNKRIRIRNQVTQIQNNIYFLYNEQYDDKKDILEALNAFQVKCIGRNSDDNYIQMIFKQMQ